MVKALIFDFDGLILDTETTEYQVLQNIYRQHGQELNVLDWGKIVGGSGVESFDAVDDLTQRTGQSIDRQLINNQWREQSDALILEQPILPGVSDYLEKAREIGLQLAIASSSPHRWVDGHLSRLGLFDYFDVIICADDVSRVKPAPDLYFAALKALNLDAQDAIVFEDSPNGVKAAQAVGIFTVAVPNPLTLQLGVNGADLVLSSLADLNLSELIELRKQKV